jgi:hypothetical protein
MADSEYFLALLNLVAWADVDCWQLATGNWQLATGNWQLTTDN